MGFGLRRIRRSLRGCRFKLSLGLLSFEDEFTLDLFGFLIALPFLDRFHKEPADCMDKWGVYYDDGQSIVLCWRDRCKFIHMPWQWDHCKDKHMVQTEDGSWVPCLHSWEKGGPDNRHVQEFPYSYRLKSGLVQNVIAKVSVERREWRRKCFKRIPWFAMKKQSLDISFSEEVGERSGSWKGGCVGCGWDMLPGETVEQALKRMEEKRQFN